jgi:hypothetical protein
VKQELVLWKFDVPLRRIDNTLCTCLERCFELFTVREGSKEKIDDLTRGMISAGSC